MSSLHRRALNSHKTVSKKARSRQPSVPTSRPQSNPASRDNSRSRGGSRAASDNEDGDLSDETNLSVGSLDELNLTDDHDHELPTWEEDLAHCIEDLLDRNWKRSNVDKREETLRYFNRILTLKFAHDAIAGRETGIIGAFLKSVKTDSDKEKILALKALELVTITLQPDNIYEDAAPTIKRAISDSESVAVKTAAIYTLAMVSFFGDISDDETLDNLAFLLEIISSDGGFIDAPDAPAPVVAALESYAFLATLLEDLSGESHDAIEAFLDQLASPHTEVAIAAGECIALLYEKAYASADDDDSSDSDVVADDATGRPALVRRYDPYRRTDQVEEALERLARISSRARSKKDRKSLHANFADILNSVQHPTHGPRYSSALNGDGMHFGSRLKVRLSAQGVMRVDRWWKLVRLQGLRRVLRDGFVSHYEANPAIFEALPVMLQDMGKGAGLTASKQRSKHFAGGTKGLLEVPM